jgi:Polyketide cyclase / dehydrase and lipid transport
MLIEREIEIARRVGEVFDFVADARNDVRWCRKVRSVERVADGRYAVVHKPVPGRPARRMEMTRVASDPPRLLEWRQNDGVDVFGVTYSLSPTAAGGTLLRQTSDADIGAVPRWLHPLWRRGIARDVARQLRDLKRLLEDG